MLQLPVASKLALLGVVSSIITAMVLCAASYQAQRSLIQRSADYFADSLTAQISRDASAALVQRDRLSLQAILIELTRSDVVMGAVIYDVENAAIAEAGEPIIGRSYRAPINFQEGLAGSLVLTLNQQPLRQLARHLTIQLTGLAGLLALLCWVLIHQRAQTVSVLLIQLSAILRSTSPRRMAINSLSYPGDDELKQLAADIVTPPKSAEPDMNCAATLHIDFGFFCGTETINRCYALLETICRLYEGHIAVTRNDGISAYFYADNNESNPAFRALCAGYLFVTIAADERYPEFGAGVVMTRTEPGMSRELSQQLSVHDAVQAARPAQKGLYCDAHLQHHASVRDRIEFSEDDDGFIQVLDFQMPYANLLDRQLETLQNDTDT